MPARRVNSVRDDGRFGVIAVTAFPAGRWMETFRVNFTSRASAYEACDRLQDDLDRDGDPARAYVIDAEGIPIHAGRPAHLPANHFFAVLPRKSRAA